MQLPRFLFEPVAYYTTLSFFFVFFTADTKCVNYLIAADGNPWVWVLGEGDDEKDFSKILEGKTMKLFLRMFFVFIFVLYFM